MTVLTTLDALRDVTDFLPVDGHAIHSVHQPTDLFVLEHKGPMPFHHKENSGVGRSARRRILKQRLKIGSTPEGPLTTLIRSRAACRKSSPDRQIMVG